MKGAVGSVHDRHDDCLIVWEHDAADNDVIQVRFIGTDPFA